MIYKYLAYGRGHGVVKGRLEADDLRQAEEQVIQLGYKPLEVKSAFKLPSLEDLFPSLSKVGQGEVIRMCRQLSVMLASGSNIIRALEMLQAETRQKQMKRILTQVRASLAQGDSLSSAFAQHPKVFTPLFISVVEVGEHTGRLGPALDQVSQMIESDREAKQKAVRTLMYPAAIMGLAFLTLGVLLVVAMPSLLKVFDQLGSEVPLTTRIALASMEWVTANMAKMVLIFSIIFGGLVVLYKMPYGRIILDSLILKAPFFGPFILTSEISKFSRALGMLLEAGVPLSTAMKMGMNGCRNQIVRRALMDADESLLSGHGIAKALKKHPIMPGLFVELVSIGEESNSLTRVMNESANTYQKQMEQRLNSLLAFLEPASTVMVGAIVGFIAFSMFVPIYSGLDALE
jgi:type IV pilus assembly protein PilC